MNMLTLKLALAGSALLFCGVANAAADVPPPVPIKVLPGTVGAKGATIRLADYSSLSVDQRSWQQGGTFDTSRFCSAMLDIGADPGINATIDITARNWSLNRYGEIPETPQIVLSGKEPANASGVVVRSQRIPLLHNVTSFAIRLGRESLARDGALYVFLTPLPCGIP